MQGLYLLLSYLSTLAAPALGKSVGCFNQSPDPRHRLYPTTFRACRDVLAILYEHGKSRAGVKFSRRPGPDRYNVPQHWEEGNCVVTIDMHTDNDEDVSSFHEIAIEAGIILASCVILAPHLGGTMPVGPKKVMNVTVFGRAPRWAPSSTGLLEGGEAIKNMTMS